VSALNQLLNDPGTARIFEVLDGDGEETRIAGGAVRDALLGKMPAEIDFATTAVPSTVVRRANAAGLKTAPTGIEHGTVTVVIDKRPYEVTTLRRDVETDGRHAVVAFGRDWAEDAKRRDFTINGLFLDRAGKVHDFVGGQDDLKAKRVRFIGDARTRIREDYLRILRFFRFFAGYGDGAPDPDAFSAALSERGGLDHLSRERIRAELLKLLAAPRAPEAAKIMSDAGLLGPVLAGMARPRRLARLAEIGGTDTVLRLGALSLFIPQNADRLRGRLRLSNEEASRLRAMADSSAMNPALSDNARKAVLYRLRPSAYRDRTMLAWADSGARGDDKEWQRLHDLPDTWTAPKFPVAAAEVMKHGVEQGPKLGAALAAIEESWMAAGFPDEQAVLNRLVSQAAKASQ
jgi:poly(A) polymerase